MKNCSQCPNMSDVGKNDTCKFYNKIIPNVDEIPSFCRLYFEDPIHQQAIDDIQQLKENNLEG